MTTWREIDRTRKDARGFRELCGRLLRVHRADLSEWEINFLQGNANRPTDEFTTRQGETLLGIRDGVELIETYRGFSIKSLIEGCYMARLDLSEADEEWIVDIQGYSPNTIRRRNAGKLMRLAGQLGLIEDEAAA